MAPLSPELRGQLEKVVKDARDLAETAAEAALNRLAVGRAEPFEHMSPEERDLRVRLRAKGRQLGDSRDERTAKQVIDRLLMQCAYEYWHQMLFARFLAENQLLMHPEGVAVSLEECEDLAAEEGVDAWTLASRYAARMLPQIFRPDDPLLQIQFATEYKRALERLVGELPVAVFQASDSLGWVYQFWQAKRKEEVNRSGNKIGADELPAVTQLFTEHYMVEFLLHNTLGAWWVANHPREVSPVKLDYLRLLEDGTPAAGTFPGWPKTAKELKSIDPCCGSGHFLVAVFHLLVHFRMHEEGLSARDACDAVLRDNLYGLELDERCTQIAAFALAMTAWTFPSAGGYREIPQLNIACSGIAISAKREQWLALAGDDTRLQQGMAQLYALFENAPTLGSLIDPGANSDLPLLEATYTELQPLLAKALQAERHKGNYVSSELGIAAQGIATAARLLAGRYHLVATNVPYLVQGKQNDMLKDFCESRYPEAKADLATVFVERCVSFLKDGGRTTLVTPQNWLFLISYKKLRQRLLQNQTWNMVARLGPGAFDTISGERVDVALLLITNSKAGQEHTISGIHVPHQTNASQKAAFLHKVFLQSGTQTASKNAPDSVISIGQPEADNLLSSHADCFQGISTADSLRFIRCFWELQTLKPDWKYFQGPPKSTLAFAGRETIVNWSALSAGVEGSAIRGRQAWNKHGIAIGQMNELPATLFTGTLFADSTPVIIPKEAEYLPALWYFCSSGEFYAALRKLNSKLSVNNGYVVKISFDLTHWQKVAEKMPPLPEPHSEDPTQWLFDGTIGSSTEPLQVAVARLLSYCWPEQQLDTADELADDDGIVCLPAVRGEQPAAERLRAVLAKSYDDDWSPTKQKDLLTSVGYGDKSLDAWLRNGFFEQHCKLFHHRPFIWHIWDSHKEGFAALINYHKCDRRLLETLTYTYLGDWIRRQQDSVSRGESGADAKLLAAQKLHEKMKLILAGEKPYDIFVRWKPLEAQPIGWEPDLNDGVRLNIRPFVQADILRKKPNIKWGKDRGKNPPGSPWGEERNNDLHFTLSEKQQAREAALLRE